MTQSKPFRLLVASIALSTLSIDLHAATPDASTFQRDIEVLPPKPSRVFIEPCTSNPSLNDVQRTIDVNGFVIQGATLINEASLISELNGFVGKSMCFEDLDAAASLITAAYSRAGYLGKAFIPLQEVRDGVVTIRVFEACLVKTQQMLPVDDFIQVNE